MSAEQDLANANVQIANLISEVTRFRDAAMGINNIWPTITEGRNNTADGKYFSVPGDGAYLKLYRRAGSSQTLIAEFPDRAQVQGIVDVFGGRGVTGGAGNLGSFGDLVRLGDAVFAARATFGEYPTGSSNKNVDELLAGDCGLYNTSLPGVFPEGITGFVWIETQRTYAGESLVQTAVNYASSAAANAREWKRVCASNRNSSGQRVWGPWVEFFSRRNILGTVSQSGGIPTGAIIERGSNANGEYVKFADGTLIIHTAFKEITIAGGGSSNIIFDLPTPTLSTFSSGLTIAQNTGGSLVLATTGRARCDNNLSATVRIANPNPTEQTASFIVTHIGRWY